MENIKISVIIPVYNVEKYLEECLESAVGQSLKEIEVICVNDGSTDKSGNILDEYSKKDSRIKVFYQENAGQSAARNNGARRAKGEYLYFFDSDDIIVPKALELLYEKASKDNLDIVYFDADSFCEEKGPSQPLVDHFIKYYHRGNDYPEVYLGYDLMKTMFEKGDYRNSPCLQMIKREYFFFRECFFAEGVYHEDNMYTFKSLLMAQRVGYIHQVLYRRRVRPNSIMTCQISTKHISDYFINYLMMKDFLKSSEHKEDEVINSLVDTTLDYVRNDYRRRDKEHYKTPDLPQKELELYKTLIEDYCEELLKNTSKLERLKACYKENGLLYTIGHSLKRFLNR